MSLRIGAISGYGMYGIYPSYGMGAGAAGMAAGVGAGMGVGAAGSAEEAGKSVPACGIGDRNVPDGEDGRGAGVGHAEGGVAAAAFRYGR